MPEVYAVISPHLSSRERGKLSAFSRETLRANSRTMARRQSTARQVFDRIQKRLKALDMTANKAGVLAGQRDAIRSIQRGLRENNQSGINSETLKRLAPVLQTSVEWLLTETGPEEAVGGHIESSEILPTMPNADEKWVEIVGYVGAGAQAHRYAVGQGHLERVPPPEGSTDKTVAVQIMGDSLGELFDRWLVFYDDVKRPITADLVGKICVVGLSDDRVLIKKIRRSKSKAGGFDLLSNTEPPIEGIEIVWAARVKNMVPR